jgi:hypothetical protein
MISQKKKILMTMSALLEIREAKRRGVTLLQKCF